VPPDFPPDARMVSSCAFGAEAPLGRCGLTMAQAAWGFRARREWFQGTTLWGWAQRDSTCSQPAAVAFQAAGPRRAARRPGTLGDNEFTEKEVLLAEAVCSGQDGCRGECGGGRIHCTVGTVPRGCGFFSSPLPVLSM